MTLLPTAIRAVLAVLTRAVRLPAQAQVRARVARRYVVDAVACARDSDPRG